MFVCVCKAVRAAEIDTARGQGMRSWEEVAGVCGAGTECGACQDQIDEIIRTPLIPGVVLDRAEQVAIRESCTVRVRR